MRVLMTQGRRRDHGAAQVALAAALAAEGLTPTVGGGGADVALVFSPDAPMLRGAVRPRVALVDALEPASAWRGGAERWAVVDEAARQVLLATGIPGDRVVVTGWPLAASWTQAPAEARPVLLERFGLDRRKPVVLVDTREVDEPTLGALVLQLSLAAPLELLFDAPDEAAASLLRARCPTAGLRARRFADVPEAPLLWRAADLVIGRPTPQLVARARLCGLAIIALVDAENGSSAGEAAALAARGLGRSVTQLALLASTLDRFTQPGDPQLETARQASATGARPDAAKHLARFLAEVAQRREEILVEPPPAAPASGGPLEEVGLSSQEYQTLAAERLSERIQQTAADHELEGRLAALKARLRQDD